MTLKILALDTATEACSAALILDHHIIHRYQLAPRQHTQLVLPMLQALLDEAGVTLPQLDAIAFGRGPGSFTGIRIAASIAQAAAFAHDLPVIPISTLQALAQGAYRKLQSEYVVAAIDARMNEIYWGAYKLGKGNNMLPIMHEIVCAPNEIKLIEAENALGVGSGWDSYHTILQNQLKLEKWQLGCYPDAYDIAVLAQQNFLAGMKLLPEEALPVYLRDKVTKT